MTTKQTKENIFHLTQKLDETYWFDWTDEEIAAFGNLSRTCSVNQKETREERKSNQRRNACNISR